MFYFVVILLPVCPVYHIVPTFVHRGFPSTPPVPFPSVGFPFTPPAAPPISIALGNTHAVCMRGAACSTAPHSRATSPSTVRLL